jgi:hypothetical protein
MIGGTMKSPRVALYVIGTAILTLTGCNLFAQGAAQMTVAKPSPIVQLADAPPAGYSTLYSNLGPSTDAYDDEEGWAITGPDGNAFWQNIAVPFTPTANSTIQAIQVALAYYGSGTNAAAVAILSDSDGLPGKILKGWNVSNLPKSGTCCKLVTVTDPAGIRVAAGTQIWIAVGTDKASDSAYDTWDWTYKLLLNGPYAGQGSSSGGKWTYIDDGSIPAFAIYGTVQESVSR